MPAKQPSSSPKDHAAAAADAAPAPDVFAEIVRLARGSASQPHFLMTALQCVARHHNSPYAALHVRYSSEVVQHDWHTGPTDPKFWKTSLQQFLTESLTEPKARAKLLKAKTGSTRVAFLSTPIFDASGPAIGAIALVVAPVEDDDLTRRLSTLEAMTRLISFAAEFVGTSGGRERGSESPGTTKRAGSDTAVAQSAGYSSPEELAFAMTNDLCNRLGCEQVALGLLHRRRVRVISISGFDSVNPKSPGVACLQAAMEECYDADRAIVQQAEGDWTSERVATGYRLHKKWHAMAQGESVASIPLHTGEVPAAILSLRRGADQPFTPEQIEEVRARVEPFAPALVLVRRANRSLTRHMLDGAHGAFDALVRPGRLGTKVMTAVVAMLSFSFLFGSLNYELTVPCVVTPASIRHITAPFAGMLADAQAREGDYVQAGAVLCRFDSRDLRQNSAELQAELVVWERVADRARAAESPVEVKLAAANYQLTSAKLQIVETRIAQAALRAPFDGIIVAGDLRKQIGSVFARGDPLYEVAPLTAWRLEVQVPESASADLQPGLSGYFATFARPDHATDIRISRVLAQAQVRGGRNVYVAEAVIDAQRGGLRAGMEGIAKIDLGRRPIWWITLHRAIDYLRMNLWL